MMGAGGLTAGRDAESLTRVVHDLRSPLTVIRGLCFALGRDESRPDRRRQLDLIDAEVERLSRGLARLVSPAPPAPASAPACLVAAATAAVARHREHALAEGVRVTLRTHAAAAPVAVGADALDRVLDNLIANAVRHSPPGGVVRLAVRVRGAHASLTVRDQGAGVAAGDRERIFLPGERGSAPCGDGQGLGLAICRDIAERHGGARAEPAHPLLRVVPRPAGGRLGRRRPRALDPESVLDVLGSLDSDAIVLARPLTADPGAACLPQLAALRGVPALRLPTAPESAAWAVALALHWAGAGQDDLLRRLEVAVALPEGAAGRRPAVRPPVLARWAGRAWRPCAWCAGGGPPGRCGRCGVAVAA